MWVQLPPSLQVKVVGSSPAIGTNYNIMCGIIPMMIEVQQELYDQQYYTQQIAGVTARRIKLMKKYGFDSYSDDAWKQFKDYYWKTFPTRKFYY